MLNVWTRNLLQRLSCVDLYSVSGGGDAGVSLKQESPREIIARVFALSLMPL